MRNRRQHYIDSKRVPFLDTLLLCEQLEGNDSKIKK